MSHVNRFVVICLCTVAENYKHINGERGGCGKLFLLTLNYQQNFMLGACTFYGYDSACTLEIRYVPRESDVLAADCKNM